MKKNVLLSVFVLLAIFAAPQAYAVQVVSSDTTDAADGRTNGAHFTGDFTLAVADNSNLNTNANANGVTTATTNTGSLGFLGTSTVTGIVGSSSSVLLKQISGGQTQETVTFSGNVFATTTTVTQTGTLTFNGNLTGTSVNYAGDGTVRMGDNTTISPAITTSTNNTGSLDLAGTATVSGQVGSNANRLRLITGGKLNEIDTFSSDVFAVTTSVQDSGTLVMNGNLTGSMLRFDGNGTVQVADGKSIISATVNTVVDNAGSLAFLGASTISTAVGTAATGDLRRVEISGGVVTLNSGTTYAVNDTDVRPLGTLRIDANTQTITGNVTLNGTGTLDVDDNTVTVTGTYTQPANSTFKTKIVSATQFGNVVATANDPTIAAGSTINVNVAGYIANGTAFTIVDTDNGAAGVAVPTTITDNSAAISFAGSGAGGDLILTATRSVTGLTSSSNTTSVATAVTSFTPTGDLANALGQLDTLPTAAEYDSAVQQLDPDMNGGVNQAAFNTTQGAFNTIGTRLDNVRAGQTQGGGQKGIAMGDDPNGTAIWLQGFGASADQDTVNGIIGYDTSTWGTAGGVDWELNAENRIGLSFAYALSDVEAKGGSSNTDAESYVGTIYGDYQPDGKPYYLDWMFGFGWNAYDGTRNIQFGTVNRAAESDYDGQQYNAKVTFGYNIPQDTWKFVPMASLAYSHLDLDGYTETGAGELNLVVDDQSYDFLATGLGAKIVTSFVDGGKHKWVPEFNAMWIYEFIQDEADTDARFTGAGSPSFNTKGLKPEQSRFNLGAGITYWLNDSLALNARYDLELREDYVGHGGTGTLKYEF